MTRAAAIALVALAAAGCMTYDFEPVVPLAVGQTTQKFRQVAKKKKPNVMLLVDKSGSMNQRIDPNCVSNCRTRIGELRDAMQTFLTQSATDARFGLTFFPTDNACGTPSTPAVDLPSPTPSDENTDSILSTQSWTINQRIQAVLPNGGTPTAASLAFVGSLPGLLDPNDGRSDFILLLTDGLPNCNAANPNHVCACDAAVCSNCGGGICQAQDDRCRCTLPSCRSNEVCRIGCLDMDAVVEVTRANSQKLIKTIVVGFGAETASSDAQQVLQAIAKAGGYPRNCQKTGTDADCGPGNTCDRTTKLCSRAFYQAVDATELTNVLRDIINNITGNPCEFELDTQPARPEYISVIVNGRNVVSGPDTWQLTGGKVVFADDTAICRQIKASTEANPVDVQIRVLETF
jgi:hypothetical protein